MFEYIDDSGEVISVRSARSLPMLMAKGILAPSTLFRDNIEHEFKPAFSSLTLQRLNAEHGVLWGAEGDAPIRGLALGIERPTGGHKAQADEIALGIREIESISSPTGGGRNAGDSPTPELSSAPANPTYFGQNQPITTRGAADLAIEGKSPIVIRVEIDETRPQGHARIVLRETTPAVAGGGFRLMREGYVAANLGPDGWDTSRHDLRAIAVEQENEETILIVGPSVVCHMEPGTTLLVLLANASEAEFYWPDKFGVLNEKAPSSLATEREPVPQLKALPRPGGAFERQSALDKVGKNTKRFSMLVTQLYWLNLALAAVALPWLFMKGVNAYRLVSAPPVISTMPTQPTVGTHPAATPRELLRSFRDCPECPEMVVIPAGQTYLASGRNVRIASPFAVGKFEVTFEEWDACVTARGCTLRPANRGWGGGRRPVMNVNWYDAEAYVTWLSRATRKTYRLLSEAEWEYAAQAGSAREQVAQAMANQANCDGCGSSWDNKQTAPVGRFEANAFGLHDMLGNVWEWTADCWNESHAGAAPDGSARITGECQRRVLRGGSWFADPRDTRSARRFSDYASFRLHFYGFRVARTL